MGRWLMLWVAVCLLAAVNIGVDAKKNKSNSKPAKRRIGDIVEDLETNVTALWGKVEQLSNPVHVHVHGDGHVMDKSHMCPMMGMKHKHGMHHMDRNHSDDDHGDHHKDHDHADHHPGQKMEDVNDHDHSDHHKDHDHGDHHQDHDDHHTHHHHHHHRDSQDSGGQPPKRYHNMGNLKHHREHQSLDKKNDDDDDDDDDDDKKIGKKNMKPREYKPINDQAADKKDDKDNDCDHDHGDDDDDFHHGGKGNHVHIHLHTGGMMGQMSPHTSRTHNRPESEEYRYARCDVKGNSALPLLERQDVSGVVHFRQKPGGPVDIELDVKGFTVDDDAEPDHRHARGMHGHVFGDMSNGCDSMGGHFNPWGVDHGGPGHEERHPGDFGNIMLEEDGTSVVASMSDDKASLFGDASLLGRGLVIHAGEDDLGQGGDAGSKATGNAGKRLACCVIVATGKPDGVW